MYNFEANAGRNIIFSLKISDRKFGNISAKVSFTQAHFNRNMGKAQGENINMKAADLLNVFWRNWKLIVTAILCLANKICVLRWKYEN